jgi:hypothetical protein
LVSLAIQFAKWLLINRCKSYMVIHGIEPGCAEVERTITPKRNTLKYILLHVSISITRPQAARLLVPLASLRSCHPLSPLHHTHPSLDLECNDERATICLKLLRIGSLAKCSVDIFSSSLVGFTTSWGVEDSLRNQLMLLYTFILLVSTTGISRMRMLSSIRN